MDNFRNPLKHLKDRLGNLDYEREMIQKSIDSFKTAKYKFGDFIYTKEKYKGYITGVYTVSYISYIKNNSPIASNILAPLQDCTFSNSITLETFLKEAKQDVVFYTCRIFKPVKDSELGFHDLVTDTAILQEDLLPYSEQAKVLYDK
jgi:hypothetical protein